MLSRLFPALGIFALLASSAFASPSNPTIVSQTITEYDIMTPNGLVETRTTSATGSVTKTRTDGLGRLIEQEDAQGNITHYAYDANGNLLSTRDPNGVGQDCTYDAQNRRETDGVRALIVDSKPTTHSFSDK